MRKAALIINRKGLEAYAKSLDVGATISEAFKTVPRLTDWGIMLWYGKCLLFDQVAGVINDLYCLLDRKKGEHWSLVYIREDRSVHMEGNWQDSPLRGVVSTDICLGGVKAEELMNPKDKEGGV